MSKKSDKQNNRLWGGAHSSSDADALNFAAASDTTSKPLPENILIPYDIKTNQVHVKMLNKVGLITDAEYNELQNALKNLLEEYNQGVFAFDSTFEDIHSQIESVITDRIGDAGKKMHTGRSRNDQVTTDMYLYLHDNIDNFISSFANLVSTVDKNAEKYSKTVCPGYTHHQKAVVTSFGDILHAYSVMFKRDSARLYHIQKLYNYSPLGAVTGYESLLPIDKQFSAKELGFASSYASSIDVISTRGELETAFAHGLAQFMTHVSMMAQTLITFSSQAYKYVTIADQYTTGSSVMPQKKNPDLLEIMKAKNAYANSIVVGLSSLLQASFVGYNRDSQYSKMLIIQLVEEVKNVPELLVRIVDSLSVNTEVMLAAASGDFVTSTGFMELLVSEKKIALRDAKRLVEKCVTFSMDDGVDRISRAAFLKAVEATGIEVDINDNELSEWQDPEFQLSVRRRFGV